MVSAEVKGHHTVWLKKRDWARSVPARYALSGEALIVFGDDGLATLEAGDRATATVHRIAGGPPLASFGVTVREVPSDEVDREALIDLVAHVPMGATLPEVNARLDEMTRRRRIVALAP